MHTVTFLKRTGIVSTLVLLAWISVLNAATDGSSTEGTVNMLLTAIGTNNYDALVGKPKTEAEEALSA